MITEFLETWDSAIKSTVFRGRLEDKKKPENSLEPVVQSFEDCTHFRGYPGSVLTTPIAVTSKDEDLPSEWIAHTCFGIYKLRES
jgi:hypothetical protein